MADQGRADHHVERPLAQPGPPLNGVFGLAEQGGGRGIRTPGTREGPTVFKTDAIVRSAIPPLARLAEVGVVWGDGAPGEIRTPDPLIRSQMLYPD